VIDGSLTGLDLPLQKWISDESSIVSRDSKQSPCCNSKSSSTVQHSYACRALVMKLEQLVKLRTEVSNLESKIGKNLRFSSPASVWSNSHG